MSWFNILVLFFSACLTAFASDSNGNEELKSKFGSIDFNNLLASYYSLIHLFQERCHQCEVDAWHRFRNKVWDIFLESPSKCLSIANEAHDDFFSAFLFSALSFCPI
jgi:hypothetical protein